MVKVIVGQQMKIKLKDFCDDYVVGEYGELTLKKQGKTVAIFKNVNGSNNGIMFGHSLNDGDKETTLAKLVKTIGLVTFFVSHEVLTKAQIPGAVMYPSDDSKHKVEAKVYNYDALQEGNTRELRADKLPSSIQEMLYSGSIGALSRNNQEKNYYFKLSDIKDNNENKMMKDLLEKKVLLHESGDPLRDYVLLNFAVAYKNDVCQNTGTKFVNKNIVVLGMEEEVLPDFMNKTTYNKIVAAIKAKMGEGKVLFPYFYVHKVNPKVAHILFANWTETSYRLNFNQTDVINV